MQAFCKSKGVEVVPARVCFSMDQKYEISEDKQRLKRTKEYYRKNDDETKQENRVTTSSTSPERRPSFERNGKASPEKVLINQSELKSYSSLDTPSSQPLNVVTISNGKPALTSSDADN